MLEKGCRQDKQQSTINKAMQKGQQYDFHQTFPGSATSSSYRGGGVVDEYSTNVEVKTRLGFCFLISALFD